MTTLYEIESERFNLLRVLSSGTASPEEVDAAKTDIERLMQERDEKLQNICCYTKNLEADITSIKAEITRLKEMVEAKERKIERLRNYVETVTSPTDRWQSGVHKIYYSKSKAVEPLLSNGAGDFPDEFARVKTERTPDKVAIREALESGKEVAGWGIVERTKLQIK